MTATDIAVRLGMVELGDKSKVESISGSGGQGHGRDPRTGGRQCGRHEGLQRGRRSDPVGGGSIILPEKISGAATGGAYCFSLPLQMQTRSKYAYLSQSLLKGTHEPALQNF